MRGRALGAVLLVALSAPSAHAQPEADAARAFDRGEDLYGQGLYREAIVQFQTAYSLVPHPASLFNVARCHENLGELAEALAFYERVLADPAVENREEVEERIRSIRSRTVTVFVSTVPAGARIRLDGGEPLAVRTPAVVETTPGPHVFTLELEGRRTVVREVQVTPAEPLRLRVALDPALPDDASIPTPTSQSSVPPPDGAAQILEEIRTRREATPLSYRLGLLVGAGKYSAASFAVGADLGVVWKRVLANVHWLTYTQDFVGGIDLELAYDHPFDDFDFFAGGGAGYMRIRREDELEEGVFALPFQENTVFTISFVAGVDFFLRRSFAVGAALRLVLPFDDDLRDMPGGGRNAFSLQSATVQVTIHL